MKPFRRKRRAADNRYLKRDAKAWGRLVKAAFAEARAARASGGDLRKAADGCAKAVPPLGHATRDSDFLALMSLGRLWWRLAPAVQAEHRPKLERLAQACAEVLDRVTPLDAPTDLTRVRLDIFG